MTFWGKWGSTPPSIKQPMEKENTTSRSMALEDCTQLHAGHIAVGGVWLKLVCSKTADNEHVSVMFFPSFEAWHVIQMFEAAAISRF